MYKKLLFNLFIVLTTSSIVGAKIYLWEDFEGFTPGESLDTTGVWVQQGSEPLGIASNALSYPSGGISGYFEERAGIRHIISEGELPNEFVISAWYYHDASGPPPHYMLVFRGPAGSDWLGVGTVETVENYSIRDKRGTGQETDTGVPRKDWVNIVWQVTQDGTEIFLDGQSVYTSVITGDTWRTAGSFIWFANVWAASGYAYLDSIGIADTLEEIGKSNALALNPSPANGALIEGTWANLSWSPGDFAVSHDIYIGDNFDDVNSGAENTFVGNQADTFIVVGFPGFAFPDGLVPGTTYYWRIDEVNEAEPNSPWKGEIWSFSIPPKTAYFPDPANGAEAVETNVQLSWTGGFGSKLHTVYFGENFQEVDSATGGQTQGSTTYRPGTLKMAKTYYWRVDEFDIIKTHKGNVWSFTTEGAVSALNPVNGAVDVTQTPVLTWTPGFGATHEIFFGTDASALEKKGSGNLGAETYEPGQLEWNTTYYWRVDEANNANADSPWTGPVWSFTTANFLIIDDMEAYNDLAPEDPESNRIFNAWIDGFEDPTNGSLVGYDNAPFAEQTIVHSGNQSMPMAYDNSVDKSEATLTLTSNRDWTVNGVNTLTIWFRGSANNTAETLYVTLNGSARVDNDNPDAALANSWTAWNIDLQSFADQGVNLTNVNSITLGLSSVTGGAGMMYFDDIRLYPPAQ